MKKKTFTSFLLLLMLFFISSCCQQQCNTTQNLPYTFDEPTRAEGQKDVLELRCAPIDTVRIALIGLGMRGYSAIERFVNIEGCKIVAFCDVDSARVKKSNELYKKLGGTPAAEYYDSAEAWKKACEDKNVDLVYICTPWDLHVPMAVYAMEQGKHAAIEVPATTSLKECWQLVDVAEKTQRHCMMLENCCYDFFEMATLNMAQQGVFGEIVHCEGAYIHDLRFLNFDDTTGYHDMWRLKHNEKHTGNPYPTHGLGPVAQILNIHRGDKMEYLTSMSSDQFGMTLSAKEKFGEESEYAKKEYALGDMNTTVIKTNKGKTIMIQHDVTSPRPYSRIHLVSGTKGFAQKWPIQGIALEPNAHGFLPANKLDSMLALYEHPITKEIGALAREVGGHGGMDFIMDYRLIYCLRNGLPLDQDVYDAAEWSCIGELSEYSVRNNSIPVKVPDFTRGAWNKVRGYKHAMKE